jgi:hypothetical protein
MTEFDAEVSIGLAPTIFHEPWWLTLVSNGTYREAEVRSGDRIVGRLPYVSSRRFGMTLLNMPMFTHFLGPAIDDGIGNDTTRFLSRLSIVKELVRQLPPAAHVYVKHHRGVADTIGFQALGFSTDVQFTREIAPKPHAQLWSQMRDKTRNVIRRADERYTIVDRIDPREFSHLYAHNLAAKNVDNYYDLALCERLIDACVRRGVGRVLGARDADGSLKAATFTVWDAGVEYYLMSTRASGAGNGAVSLLVWQAMKDAAMRNVIFDFDGFKESGDAQFFSGFGGTIAPRYVSYRNSRAFKLMNALSERRIVRSMTS